MNTTPSYPNLYTKLMMVFIGFFCLIQCHSGLAQNIETVFSDGYYTQPDDIDRFNDGRWLITYTASNSLGTLYKDTIYARIIDSTASLIRHISLSPLMNYENLTLEGSLVLPDDEFLIMYSGGDCDAGGYGYFIQKFDSLMQPAWHIPFPQDGSTMTFAVSPDKNILFLAGREIGKMSPIDGSVLWRKQYTTGYINDAIVVPGTENIIMANGDGLYYFEQQINQGEISYALKASKEIEIMNGYFGGLMAGPDGNFYVRKYNEKEILKFRTDLEYEVIANVTIKLMDVTPTVDGIALMNRRSFQDYELLFYDTTGLLLDTYISNEVGLRPFMMQGYAEGVGIAGIYGSGPPWTYDSTFLYRGREQGWFRYFPIASLVDSAVEVSMSITDIIQQDSIDHTTYWINDGFYEGYVHDYEGGDFKLKLTNSGNEPVHSFWINIFFGEVLNIFWCNPSLATQVLIQNDTILPGESYWYEFGDISAYRQMVYPDAFCFWTSGPNDNPDFLPDDDVHCHQRIVNTNSVEPQQLFSVFPNPVHEEINILFETGFNESIEWQLINSLGQKIKSGKWESHSGTETIKVSDVPSGIYYFQSNGFSKILSIQHH